MQLCLRGLRSCCNVVRNSLRKAGMMTVKKVLLSSVVIGWFASGCGSSKYMRPVSGPDPVGTPPNKARVVFVRPSDFQLALVFTIIDERGYFLGDSTGSG